MAEGKIDGKAVIKTYENLASGRDALNKTWADCFKYSYPLRGAGLATGASGTTAFDEAKTDKADLLDSTATEGIRLLASSILSAITPSASIWQRLVLDLQTEIELTQTVSEDLPKELKLWLEAAAVKMHKGIHSSNYDSEALEFFIDISVAGTSPLYIEMREGKLHFETWSLRQTYGMDSMGLGRIDTVYKQCDIKIGEAVKKGFKLPKKMQDAFDKDPYTQETFPFIYVIRPRPEFIKKPGFLKSTMPYESAYIFQADGTVAYESGFQEFPVVMPRWMKIPGTDDAIGPMFDALPDMKTLNTVVELMMQSAEMNILGTWVYVDDGIFNPNNMKIGPGKLNAVGDKNSLSQVGMSGDIGFAIREIVRLQEQVKKMLLANQLAPTEKVNMTAAEVYQRNNMLRQVLGPVFSRLQAEFLQPLIVRVFGLMLREGLFGELPADIDASFNIEYCSPLARAMRATDLEALQSWEANLGQMAQYDPSVLDNIDLDEAAQLSHELLGVPTSVIREPAQVAKMRQDRAAAQQAAQEQQQNQDMTMEAMKQAPTQQG